MASILIKQPASHCEQYPFIHPYLQAWKKNSKGQTNFEKKYISTTGPQFKRSGHKEVGHAAGFRFQRHEERQPRQRLHQGPRQRHEGGAVEVGQPTHGEGQEDL